MISFGHVLKEACLVQVNPDIKKMVFNQESEVSFKLVCDEAEIDEQRSFVGKKSNQRWLWYAIDHVSGNILAYVFGKRKDDVLRKLKALLEPLGIQRFNTDDWGACERNIDQKKYPVGNSR